MNKFGLEGMAQTWASELEVSGARVNWVDPAWIAFPYSAKDS
jgi:NAD(P)-dependent dehydrogenase (short-subunit alcohol dehydrogenase family)